MEEMSIMDDFAELLKKYHSQSKLEVKVMSSRERPEYNDRIVSYQYTITINMDSVEEVEKK